MVNYTLIEPITIDNGVTLSELHMEFNGLKFNDMKCAKGIRRRLEGDAPCSVARLDVSLQFAVAFVAALKATPGLTLDDVIKISMADILELADITCDNYFFQTRKA